MRARTWSLRSACVAATTAVVVASVSAPAVMASTASTSDQRSDAGSSSATHLSVAQLDKLSKKYTPQSDGTPGLVADAAGTTGTSGASAQTQKQALKGTSSQNDGDVDGFVSKGSVETIRGAMSTLALNGTTDWVGISSAGTVARYDAAGHIVWQQGGHDLSAAWDITPVGGVHHEDLTPQLYEGYNPYQPSAAGTHPFAQADFNHDGTADVAVAYQLGVSPDAPFTTPGSKLQSGTFVSVFDGRTGAMLWHQLVAGTVGSMTVQDGTLIVAETTGPRDQYNPVPEQSDSRSALLGYRFSGSGHTSLTGTKAWTYSTKAPYADWSDVENLGSGQVTAGWTDTPLGLGNPRPAAGHVIVVDAKTGKAVIDVKTPGYPRIVQPDATSGRVLVAEQNDPTDDVNWSLTTVDTRTGARKVVMTHEGAIPESVQVNRSKLGIVLAGQPQYVVSELGINADLTDGASSVLGLSATGKTTWSYTTKSTVGADESPVTAVSIDPLGQVLVAVSDGVAESLTSPEGPYHTQLVALSARTGKVAWSHDGNVASDQVTPYLGGYLTVGYDLTAWRTNVLGKATAEPLLGDLYASDATDVNHDGTPDLIVGGQSHGIFALDGKSLKGDAIKVLWETPVSAGVHAVHVADVADSHGKTTQRVVAATSDGFAVLDPKSGKLVSDTATGAFQYDTPVIGGHVVASNAHGVSAYDASGHAVWSYAPAAAKGKNTAFSVPATDGDGHLFLEYGGVRTAFGSGTSDPAPTGVSLDAAKGTERWSFHPAEDPQATWIEPQAGVYASSDIPGAGGHGVAFAFGGDKPATGSHTMMIVDGLTGTPVGTHTSSGSATFQGYASSPTQGLLWLHSIMTSVLPADGSDQYESQENSYLQNGVVATAQDGSEMLVAGTGGIFAYSLPFPNDRWEYQYGDASAFAYYAGHVTALPLDKDKATDLVGLQQDYTAYNLNENVGGFSADPYATDAFPHGLTVLQATGTSAAAAKDAAAPAPSAAETKASTGTVTLDDGSLPVGVASAPHKVLSKTAVSPSMLAKSNAADDGETTRGYTPQQIQKRLGLTGDGTGQTVAISIAYDYPSAKSDLNHYAAHFDLPLTCDADGADQKDCFDFQTVYADGTKPVQDDGWNEEAALDIESVHSVAPHAKIVLVEGKDASAEGLYKAIDTAASLHPAAINNSWGMPEFSEESFYDGHCDITTVCTQSTGDDGHPSGYSSTNVHVLAVGGTNLALDADGNTTAETAWSSTGGGLSYFEKRPSYQDGVVSSPFRGTPDVSFVADPNTGVAVYVTLAEAGGSYWMQVGGTSLSSPMWAGIIATADQLRVASGKAPFAAAGAKGDTIHKAVYSLGSALNDVTSGSNGYCGLECTAGPGYDTVTGLGSPLAGIDKALASKE
ncbi:S53 family peptidase [Luteimicrobium sp. DT211]|uniref:S53 family peptidase n=1 Tax=Luteimicrobium sp. DT211 TaxID=3393412 RepID=UPI003CEFA71B